MFPLDYILEKMRTIKTINLSLSIKKTIATHTATTISIAGQITPKTTCTRSSSFITAGRCLDF